MQRWFRTLIGVSALTVFGAGILAVVPNALAQAPAAAGAQKKPKDTAEYDIFNAAIKDIQANNSAKAITDLDTWTQKYPESDYKDDRLYYYMQAYSKATPPQPGKVIEYGQQLMDKGLDKTFTDAQGPTTILNILYLMTATIPTIPNPTPDQLALGDKAAHQLLDYLPTFFANDKKPAGTTDAAWTQARGQLETAAKKALIAISLTPGNQAMAKKPQDCVGAEAAYKKGLLIYPDSSVHAYQLALALRCQQKESPEKIPQAVYEFQRAAVIDPTLGGAQNPKTIQDFADNAYNTIHGSNEGLDQLKQQVKNSPLPPAGFTIKTATQIAQEKENEFEKSNPQLALWMKVKGQLADTNGEQYFADQLKNSAVPQLRGTLVGAVPECRPKELLVAVPLPDDKSPKAEITLKLDMPLTGKPDLNAEFHWEGVPSAFTKDPFMLTMDTEKAKVEGLNLTPCTAPGPARRARARARKQ